jgi:hypothetical protein
MKDVIYFVAIWSIFRPFGMFYGHLIFFTAIWYILWPFGMLCPEKSGNPDLHVIPPQNGLPACFHKKWDQS